MTQLDLLSFDQSGIIQPSCAACSLWGRAATSITGKDGANWRPCAASPGAWTYTEAPVAKRCANFTRTQN